MMDINWLKGLASVVGTAALVAVCGYWSDPAHINFTVEGLALAGKLALSAALGAAIAFLSNPLKKKKEQ